MKTLLVAIDFSETTDAVLREAAKLAKALEAKLWVVHVASDEMQSLAYETMAFPEMSPEFAIMPMPGDVQLARGLSAEEFKREHRQLLNISTSLRKEGVDAQAILLKGDTAENIIEKAKELQADIIILGTHGHGCLRKAIVGSVSKSIIRHARCNVMIVPIPEK